MEKFDSFKSEHNLAFEVAPYNVQVDFGTEWLRFRVGTCNGLWCSTDKSYNILAIINNSPGNGHLKDVLQWFEQSCRRDKRSLKIMEVMNPKFKKHLIEKCGFKDIGNNNVERKFY